MGLLSLSIGLAAASVAAQVPQHEQPVPANAEREVSMPPAYSLPAPGGYAPADKAIAFPKLLPPPAPTGTGKQPLAGWWKLSAPGRKQATAGVLRWNL